LAAQKDFVGLEMSENNKDSRSCKSTANKAQFCEKARNKQSKSKDNDAPGTGPGCHCTPTTHQSREILPCGGPLGNRCVARNGPEPAPRPIFNVPKNQGQCSHCQKRNNKRCSIQ